ncbi:MAG: hypothetical protein HY873_12410 [Chloroflexi bacterium]|nr:hypothetical protein [Chloroflexota bacterium]
MEAVMLLRLSLAILFLSALVVASYGGRNAPALATGQTITTIAGTGTAGFSGDGGPANSAEISDPGGLVVLERAGLPTDIYFSDTGNCRVRLISGATGLISTVAGDGTCALSGDGGQATSARLNQPRGLAIDAAGNLLIADTGNCRVRKVDALTGTISSIATACAWGVAPATNGHVFIAEAGTTCRITLEDGTVVAGNGFLWDCGFDGDGQNPLLTALNQPHSVTLKSDTVYYIADTENCRIRRYVANSDSIETFAGNGTCAQGPDTTDLVGNPLDRPSAILREGDEYLFTEGCRVRRIIATLFVTNVITLAGSASCGYSGDDGDPLFAQLNAPAAADRDSYGWLYIADSANNRIRKVFDPSTDPDSDNVPTGVDNCSLSSNPSQVNTDRNFTDNTPPSTQDDYTWINSDPAGDACDADDDNDGLSDAAEASGCNGSGPLNATNPDTDGDLFLDGPECTLGTNPNNAAIKPSLAACAASGDADGDRISNQIEVCKYNTNPNNTDTDGDQDGNPAGLAKDGCEAASLNNDRVVNSADQLLMVNEINREPTPSLRLRSYDINRDGSVNSADQLIQGQFISTPGQCP